MALLVYEVEQAFVGLLGPAAGGANVYGGRSATDKLLPCVICAADGDEAQEDPKGSGNYWINVTVAVKGTAATEANQVDPTPADVALAARIFAALQVTDLDLQINAQGRTLTVMGFIMGTPKESADEQNVWIDELPIRLYCCGSNLAP